MKRFTPQQLVVGLGVAIALFTVGSGLAPGLTGFDEESSIHREVFGNIPDALKLAFYTVIPVLLVYGAVLFSPPGAQLGAGRPRQPADHAEERQAPPGRLPGRRLHADPAARPRRRHHALAHLLQLPDPARASPPCSRSTTSCPTTPSSSTATSTRPTPSSATSPAWCFLTGVVVGHRPPLRPAALPHPHQVQARARRDPRHCSSCIGVTGFGAEVFRIALDGRPTFEKWSFVGYPLSSLVDGIDSPGRLAPGRVDRPRRCASSPSWRSCRSRCCATCSPRR